MSRTKSSTARYAPPGKTVKGDGHYKMFSNLLETEAIGMKPVTTNTGIVSRMRGCLKRRDCRCISLAIGFGVPIIAFAITMTVILVQTSDESGQPPPPPPPFPWPPPPTPLIMGLNAQKTPPPSPNSGVVVDSGVILVAHSPPPPKAPPATPMHPPPENPLTVVGFTFVAAGVVEEFDVDAYTSWIQSQSGAEHAEVFVEGGSLRIGVLLYTPDASHAAAIRKTLDDVLDSQESSEQVLGVRVEWVETRPRMITKRSADELVTALRAPREGSSGDADFSHSVDDLNTMLRVNRSDLYKPDKWVDSSLDYAPFDELLKLDNTDYVISDMEAAMQHLSLINLYEDTGGSRWTRNQRWLTGDPCGSDGFHSTQNTLQTHSWEGITCKGKHVVAIGMRTNALSGTLSDALSALKYLQVLDIARNVISGTLPKELASITHLDSFTLFETHVSGTIPSQFGTLTQLGGRLELFWNRLSGTVPSELAQLRPSTCSLGGGVLSTNQFKCPLPPLGDTCEKATSCRDDIGHDMAIDHPGAFLDPPPPPLPPPPLRPSPPTSPPGTPPSPWPFDPPHPPPLVPPLVPPKAPPLPPIGPQPSFPPSPPKPPPPRPPPPPPPPSPPQPSQPPQPPQPSQPPQPPPTPQPPQPSLPPLPPPPTLPPPSTPPLPRSPSSYPSPNRSKENTVPPSTPQLDIKSEAAGMSTGGADGVAIYSGVGAAAGALLLLAFAGLSFCISRKKQVRKRRKELARVDTGERHTLFPEVQDHAYEEGSSTPAQTPRVLRDASIEGMEGDSTPPGQPPADWEQMSGRRLQEHSRPFSARPIRTSPRRNQQQCTPSPESDDGSDDRHSDEPSVPLASLGDSGLGLPGAHLPVHSPHGETWPSLAGAPSYSPQMTERRPSQFVTPDPQALPAPGYTPKSARESPLSARNIGPLQLARRSRCRTSIAEESGRESSNSSGSSRQGIATHLTDKGQKTRTLVDA